MSTIARADAAEAGLSLGGAKMRLGPTQAETDYLEESFIQREFSGENEAVKAPQRDRVAAHILKFHPKCSSKRLRLFCLPGLRWGFEHLISGSRENVDFIGVERNFTLLEESRLHMPGLESGRVLHESLKTGYVFGRANSRARVLWSTCSAFMSLGDEDFESKQRRKAWWAEWGNWSAAWLDFSGPISREMVACLGRLEAHCDIFANRVPVAVTFLAAREALDITQAINSSGTGPDRRTSFLVNFLNGALHRRFELTDAWTYASAAGVPMGMLLGEFVLKKDAVRPGAAPQRAVTIGDQVFRNVACARSHFGRILFSYELETQVSDEDALDLAAVLRHHPSAAEKIGVGVKRFLVHRHESGDRCFSIERVDGTRESFSLKKCLSALAQVTS